MGYAKYVGRVGGLAVALGVGVAVATTPGAAWAGPSESGSSSSTSDSKSSSPNEGSGSNDRSGSNEGSPSESPGESGGEDAGLGAVGSDSDVGEDESPGGDDSEGNKKSTESTVKDKKSGSDFSATADTPKKPKRSVASKPSGGDISKSDPVADIKAAVQPKSEPVSAPPATSDVSVVEVASLTAKTSLDQPRVISEPESVDTALSSTLLSAVGLAPSADGDVPEVPGDSPLLLAGLAAFRRQTQQPLVGDESPALKVSDPSQSSLMVADAGSGESMLMAAAAVNGAPLASPVVGSPDQSTGAVSVVLNAVDPEGNPLTYSVTGQPVNGTLRVDGAGAYTYTPTTAARLAAGSTTQPDFDSFSVSVSDGAGGVTPVGVSVPVLPAKWVNQASASNVTGASPYGVAVVGNTAYVTNQGTNTVTVINTLTGQAIGAPIVVGSAPTGAVASLDGAYVFVSNRNSGTVSVIRTADNKVVDINPGTTAVDALKVGSQPEMLAINTGKITIATGEIAVGTRLYVANYASNTVSVVDISNPVAPKVIDTNPATTTTVDAIAVGSNPRGIAFAQTANGPRVYVVNRTSGTVSVIDAVTNKVVDANPATPTTIDAIKVGSTPQLIVVSGDGTRAYVTNYGSNSVSIIDTTTNKLIDANPATPTTVDAIAVPSTPIGVALSKDGALLYVANGNDRISVIDTKTRAVINTIQIDTTPETNFHTLAVRQDGSLVVTDLADRALRVVAYQRGNTAPVAIANPSVEDAGPTGAVSGSINLKDWDGDPLTYSAVVSPTKGSLTFDAATGRYTYTPTQAARDAAAQTPATDRFTIRATDPSGAYKDTASVTVQILPTPSSPSIPITSLMPIHVGDSPIGLTAAGNRLYVVNSTSNTVSIVDTSTNAVLGTIPVTAYPTSVAATADGKRVYVGYYDTVSAIDINTVTNQVTGVTTIAIPDLCATNECYGSAGGLTDVIVSPDGRFVYAARQYYFDNGSPSAISYIDPVTKTVRSTGMSYGVVDMEFATDGTTRVYMADGGYHAILMEDAVSGEFRDMWFNGIDGFWPVARTVSINPAGTRVYAVAVPSPWDSVGTKVVVYDTDRTSPTYNTHIATVTVPDGAQYVKVSADNTRAYVVHNGGKSVTVIDTATNTVIGSINSSQIGGDYAALSVGPDGTLYFTNYANDTVYAATVGSATGSQASQFSLMAAVVANSAPTVDLVVGSPDQGTGAVQVSLHASDADGNPLSYAVTQPAGGLVESLGNGEFRYTPSVASRLAAASTSTPDFDSFTVSVSDGQGGVTPVTVSVPKLPAVWANQASSSNITGTSPLGVAVVGDLAYVANQGANTVTVINTKTGAVVGNPIVVGSAPTGVLANADGSKVYVTNRNSGKVSVIRTSDRSVTSVTVGTNPEFMALNDTGTRLYVTNYGSNNVSVVDVSGQTPTLITNIAVGANPRGIAVATVNQQPRVYVTRFNGSSVAVIDANTNKQIDVKPSTPTVVDSITVGANPQAIVVSPDGARAYVTNFGSNSVSVINTATNAVDGTAITVGTRPVGVSLSKDGSLLYVANSNDTVSVVNTKTRATVATLQVDTAPEVNNHFLAVRSDGSLVVTDTADRTVRVVVFKRGNTAPVATGNPTVEDAGPTGAVSGSINLKDWDGDSLGYSAVVSPTKGSLTFDAATGRYTYTPTQAARDAAAQTPATDRFTIRATDPSGAYKDTASVTVQILPTVISGQTTAAIRSANPLTGEVRGPLGVSGSGLSYTVIGAPANGTVTVTPQGEYVYKPTLAARLAADLTTGADSDGFTVRVSGAQTNTTVTVTVPVSPARVTVDSQFAPSLGTAPAGVDMNYRRAWIVNQADGTMSIIEVPGGYTVATLPVGTSPTSVAWNFDYAWVTNQGSNTVSVIDLVYNPGATQTLSGFHQPTDVLLDYPGIVFVSNKGNGTVVAIHPQTKQVLRTFQVGQSPTKMALTGVHLYVANSGSNSVSMIDLDTNTVSAPIPVGVNPSGLTVSPDGKWVYVTNRGSNTVSVINAATNTIVGSPIVVGSQPTSLVISPDSSLSYVANSDDTVSVIDTRTNTVVRTVSIDPNPEIGSHAIALSQASNYPYRADDRIYVTDAADRTMRALAITPSPAPQLPATMTPITTGIGPGSVAIVGNYAYVVNAGSNTVSRIDTTSNTVVGSPITLGSWLTSVAADPAAQRVYVSDYYDNKIYAINTNTNTVVDSYDVPVYQYEYAEYWNGVTGVKVSRDGRRLYAVATDGAITAIDTTSKSVVGTVAAGSDWEVSADGSLLYVTGGDAIAVYDTTSLAKVGEIHVGPYQYDSSRQMTISADGTRAYVTTSVAAVESVDSYHTDQEVIRDNNNNLWRVHGRYDAVSVIDISNPASPTYNSEIASIPVVGGAGDVAVSSSGGRIYVTAADGKTVTVLDPNTKTVVGAVTTNQNPYGYQLVTVGANGTLYLTNGYDNAVYAVVVGSPQV